MSKYGKLSLKVLNLELKKISKKIDLKTLANCIGLVSIPIYTKYKGYLAEISSTGGDYYCDGYIEGGKKDSISN